MKQFIGCHIFRRFYHVMVLCFLVFPIINVTFVYAGKGDPKPLKGTYHFFGQVTCATDSIGFDENNDFSRLGGGGTASFVHNGEVTYNGDGTGTFTAQVLIIRHLSSGLGNFPIAQANISCDVINILYPGGIFTETRECVSMPTAGFNFINDLRIEFPLNYEGVVTGKNRKTIHYFDTDTIVEDITIKDSNDNVVNTNKRICNRLATGIKR